MNLYHYFQYFLIGTRNLHVMRENRHNKSHNLLQDANAAYRNFLRFPLHLQFDTGDNSTHKKKYLVVLGCAKIGPMKTMLYLKA